jgi:hypothetical protein
LREAAAGGQKAIDDAVKAIKSGEEAIKGVSDLLKGLGGDEEPEDEDGGE